MTGRIKQAITAAANWRGYGKTLIMLYALMLAVAVCLLPVSFINGIRVPYTSFYISDWLINYQGGFVRRGLAGEVLYQLYNICSFPPKIIITSLVIASFLLFSHIAWKASSYLHVSLFPLLVLLTGNFSALGFYRRDFLMLSLAYYVFLFFAKYLSTRKTYYLCLSVALSSLSVLLHEASCFFIVPLTGYAALLAGQRGIKQRIVLCLTTVTPPCIAMAAACLMKGNTETAQAIWQSWMPAFTAYPGAAIPPIGEGVAFLGYKTTDVFLFHLSLNFQYQMDIAHLVCSVVSVPITLSCAYFLLTMSPRIDIRKKTISQPRFNAPLGNMLLFQYMALTPMFTVLSCDYGRTVMYALASSLFMFYALKRNDISLLNPYIISGITARCREIADSNRHITSHWLYLTVILLTPITPVCAIHFPVHSLIVQTVLKGIDIL